MVGTICELCNSYRGTDRLLAFRIQTIARSTSVDDAAERCKVNRRTLLRWVTPIRLRAVLVVAQALWHRQQFEVATQCTSLDVPACQRLIATLREPWVLQYARTYWAHWPK